MEDYKNGKIVSGNMILNVLKRPKELIKLPEVDSKGQPIPENVAKNEKNAPRFERTVDFVDNYLAAVLGKTAFPPEARAKHSVSELKRQNGKGQLVITPALEAAVVVDIENAMRKWIYEVQLEQQWGRKVVQRDRDTEEYKKHCPDCVWTTKKGGNHKYGGWKSQGKHRFFQVRGMIEAARSQEHVSRLEKQVC